MTLYSKSNATNVSIPMYMSLENVFLRESCSMFRIILVESGTGILKVNSQSIIFMAPSIFCLNDIDLIELENECDLIAQVIYFDPTIINSSFTLDKVYNINVSSCDKITNLQDLFYLEPFIINNKSRKFYFEIGLVMYKRITYIYKKLYEEITKCNNDYWVCRSRSIFLEVLFLIQNIYTNFEEENKNQLMNPASNDINEIILYLHSNYQNKITIEELTKTFHINRTTLSEKFHQSTGMSIREYLMKLRIKLAAVMLRDTMLPISEIICRVGFNEANHFSRMFKKYMNFSPSEYRKKFFS